MRDRLDLHRALMRGTGFYEWRTKDLTGDVMQGITPSMESFFWDSSANLSFRPLPSVNFLKTGDEAFTRAGIEESAFPEDQPRLQSYMSDRPVGVALFTAVSFPSHPPTHEHTHLTAG